MRGIETELIIIGGMFLVSLFVFLLSTELKRSSLTEKSWQQRQSVSFCFMIFSLCMLIFVPLFTLLWHLLRGHR